MTTPKATSRGRAAPDDYLELVRRFPLRPIRNERELERAIGVINALLDRERLTPAEEDYLDVLGDLVERYEDVHYPMEDVSDAGMLEHLIEAKAVTQAAVAEATGIAPSRISEVLAGKRKLTREQIIKLAAYFHVSPAVFLPEPANERKPNRAARP